MRRLVRRADRSRILAKQLVDRHAARIDRLRLERLQHQQRHDHGARPVGDLVEMERKPLRQQHDLDRHHRHAVPAQHAEEREQRTREHVRLDAAAARQDRFAGALHVRGVDVVADHLEREVGLHARAHVEVALVKQRPAAMRALDAAQIDADLAFQLEVRRLGEVVHHQHVFGRDRGVGLELVDPVPVRLLFGQDGISRSADVFFQRIELVQRRCRRS